MRVKMRSGWGPGWAVWEKKGPDGTALGFWTQPGEKEDLCRWADTVRLGVIPAQNGLAA